ncbi:hypothetical protein SteCoe_21623 [Stentor coeruleus]|uniref:Protein kinase domain-containing protein n=1 Tax=Stentor coeruleus TaxID=5963 RepID=A0A1R2BP84_9CILI|nr:hypothetical protein SteCoe_21623 [Stentor coeruleus]
MIDSICNVITTTSIDQITSKYLIVEEISTGRFSKIYRVIEKFSNIERAIKIVSKTCIPSITALSAECKALQRLNHPNIIKPIELLESNTLIGLVLELCNGRTLSEVLMVEGPFSEHKTVEIMTSLFSAVVCCHKAKICHLDLKLEKFIYATKNPKSEIKVLGFGESLDFSPEVVFHDIRGTFCYMAPEVLEGNYNEKADCWSLGIIMYLLLTKSFPYTGKNNNEIYMSIQQGHIPFSHYLQNISPSAQNFLSRLLVRDLNLRLSAEEALNHEWIQEYYLINRQLGLLSL